MSLSDLPENDRISTAVVDALAEANDVDPLELEPLYRSIDPDALDSLFASSDEDEPMTHGKVRFVSNGYQVEATSTGRIHLTPEDVPEAVP